LKKSGSLRAMSRGNSRSRLNHRTPSQSDLQAMRDSAIDADALADATASASPAKKAKKGKGAPRRKRKKGEARIYRLFDPKHRDKVELDAAQFDRLATWSARRMYVHDIVEWGVFSTAILMVIFLNTILISLQTDAELQVKVGFFFSVVDSIFLGVYLFEIICKLYVFRKAFFKNGWNNFDFGIVVLSLAEVLLLFFISSLTGGFNPKIFRILRVFRAVRAFRALRVLRTITFFQSLQIIVTTLLKSIPAWGSISFLLALVLYIFAIIGVDAYGTIYPERFGNMWVALFSLFQLITLDDWFQMYDAVKDDDPKIIIFLLVFIILETFIFINLFIAVIVNNLEHLQRRNDEKMNKKLNSAKAKARLKRVAARVLEAAGNAKDSNADRDSADLDEYYDRLVTNPRQKMALAYTLMCLAALENHMYDYQCEQRTLDGLVDIVNDASSSAPATLAAPAIKGGKG
jgi:cation channel sperm-associated protein 1